MLEWVPLIILAIASSISIDCTGGYRPDPCDTWDTWDTDPWASGCGNTWDTGDTDAWRDTDQGDTDGVDTGVLDTDGVDTDWGDTDGGDTDGGRHRHRCAGRHGPARGHGLAAGHRCVRGHRPMVGHGLVGAVIHGETEADRRDGIRRPPHGCDGLAHSNFGHPSMVPFVVIVCSFKRV